MAPVYRLSPSHYSSGKTDPQKEIDLKSTRLNSSHTVISYAVFCLKKKKTCALPIRSEEHTSELQSHSDLVCRLLLEKIHKINTATDVNVGCSSYLALMRCMLRVIY